MREQLDRHLVHNWEVYEREHGKHWKVLRKHGQKYYKKVINRSERRKANINPECIPSYKQYYGWEW